MTLQYSGIKYSIVIDVSGVMHYNFCLASLARTFQVSQAVLGRKCFPFHSSLYLFRSQFL